MKIIRVIVDQCAAAVQFTVKFENSSFQDAFSLFNDRPDKTHLSTCAQVRRVFQLSTVQSMPSSGQIFDSIYGAIR